MIITSRKYSPVLCHDDKINAQILKREKKQREMLILWKERERKREREGKKCGSPQRAKMLAKKKVMSNKESKVKRNVRKIVQ